MKRSHAAVALLLSASSAWVGAQTMKPGLWEISNKMQSDSGEMEKAMADMQKQMAAMPADQRKMMQDMIAKQGVGVAPGAGGGMTSSIKICMTKEMAERNEMPRQEGDCKQTVSARAGNSMKISFVCTKPPSSGDGQVTFNGPESYSMHMNMNSSAHGKPTKMTMDSTAKWLATDCGTIKPLAAPRG